MSSDIGKIIKLNIRMFYIYIISHALNVLPNSIQICIFNCLFIYFEKKN